MSNGEMAKIHEIAQSILTKDAWTEHWEPDHLGGSNVRAKLKEIVELSTPTPETHMDAFERLAQQIEKADRLVEGGLWCDSYEPIGNRDYFAMMVREFAAQLPAPQTRGVGS